MRISNDSIILAPVSLANAWTSEPIWLGHLADYSIQLFFTGAPGGVFRLQCSNDKEQSVETAQGIKNWSLVMGSTQTIQEAGDHTWAVADASYRWVRVQWIPMLGSSGTLTEARMNGKGF